MKTMLACIYLTITNLHDFNYIEIHLIPLKVGRKNFVLMYIVKGGCPPNGSNKLETAAECGRRHSSHNPAGEILLRRKSEGGKTKSPPRSTERPRVKLSSIASQLTTT